MTALHVSQQARFGKPIEIQKHEETK